MQYFNFHSLVWDYDQGVWLSGAGAEMSFNVLDDHVIITGSTGLTDKNGKYIFEGDIDKSGHIVKHIRGSFVCNGKPIGNDLSFPEATWVEVIGNEFENPESIKNE